jgi:cephalosporin hydroxylase
MDRLSLISLISNEKPTGVGVEVGTFKGEYSKEILQRWGGTLYMVDVWNELGDEYIDASNHKNFEGGVYGECMNNIKGFEERGIMVRATSKKASELFEDNSLDFVYIDANHAYDFVKEDIQLWYPKVKSGGWIMGHDYILMDWDNPPFAENGIEYRPVVAGNLLAQPFLNGYEIETSKDKTNADLINAQGVYIGNNHFVTEKDMAFLKQVVEKIDDRFR